MKTVGAALAGVAQLVGALSPDRRVAGLNPGQATYLGCGFNPRSGRVQEAIDRCFFLMLMFPFLLSLKSNGKMSLGEDKITHTHKQARGSDT